MDIEHCVIAVTSEVAKFLFAADKTPLQRLSYMSCRPPPTLAGFGVFDGAKLRRLFELAKKIAKLMNYSRRNLPVPCLIHRTNCGNTGNGWSIAETT